MRRLREEGVGKDGWYSVALTRFLFSLCSLMYIENQYCLIVPPSKLAMFLSLREHSRRRVVDGRGV